MSAPIITLVYGEPYQCERALAARDAAIAADERIVRFGDELDLKAFAIELSSGSLFAPRRHFVLRHPEAITPIRTLYPIITGSFAPDTYLTLVAENGPATAALAKKIKPIGDVQGFPRPRGKSLTGWARTIFEQHGVPVSPEIAAEVALRTGGDLLAAAAEADKLATYARSEPITLEVMSALAFTSGEESAYPIVDRVGERDLPAALAALSAVHINSSRVFSILVHHLTRLLSVRMLIDAGFNPGKMAPLIGVPEWLARRLFGQARNYTLTELAAALACGIELDQAVKRGGVRAEDALIQLLIVVTSRQS